MANFLHKDQGGAADSDCGAEARAIAKCLAAGKESSCSVAVMDLYQCCAAMYLDAARTGKAPPDVKAQHCPLPDAVRAALNSVV